MCCVRVGGMGKVLRGVWGFLFGLQDVLRAFLSLAVRVGGYAVSGGG